MPIALAEAHDLVLDRGAITRPFARNLARIHGRAVDDVADDAVSGGVRARNAALNLGVIDALRQHGERLPGLIARLHLDCGPVDGAAVEARRRSGLEPPERKPQSLQS